MPFSREFIRNIAKECGVEVPKEMETALVNEHLAARDAYAEQQVKAYQAEHPVDKAPNPKDSQEYKDLKKEYDDYKADQEKKATRTAKETAYRELLLEAGIPEKRLASVLRVSDLDAVELDDKGKIKGADKMTESIKTEWADFIPTTTTKGTQPATPPAGEGGKDPSKMTMEEYIKYRKGE